jgi:hypothetical protein
MTGTTTGSVEARLAHGESQLIDRVFLGIPGNINSLKDFELYVSDTDDSDSSFTRVLQGRLQNTAGLHGLSFPPVRARFVKLVALSNYGGNSLDVSELQVYTAASDGNIVSLGIVPETAMRLESPAQSANGATVVSYSSATGTGTTPKEILDYSPNGYWQTTAIAGQFAIIQLAGGPQTLTGVQLAGWNGPHAEAVKDFEVWVSPDNTPGSYRRALAATALNDGSLQSFVFPAETNVGYVKYVPLTPASPTATRLLTLFFDVMAEGTGRVVDFSSQWVGLAYRPERAFDANSGTTWATASGSTTNQFVTVRLPGAVTAPRKIYGVRIYGNGGAGPKDFEVRVSDDGASYATVLTATYPNNSGSQEFVFQRPEAARYVQFFFKNGYASYIEVRELEVLPVPDAGAAVVAVSNGSGSVLSALDLDPATTWSTASGQNANQSLDLLLPAGQDWLLDRLVLEARNDGSSPREFELWVSTTSTDAAAFARVFSGTLRRDGFAQTFFFAPVRARFARLVLANNYGASWISLGTFHLVSPEVGSLEPRFVDRSADPDGQLAAYAWSFGDGGVSSDRDPTHVYAPAEYSVLLDVTSASGLHDTASGSYLAIGPSVASFTFAPQSPDEGQNVVFTDSTNGAYPILLREWSFGDGQTLVSTQTTANHR